MKRTIITTIAIVIYGTMLYAANTAGTATAQFLKLGGSARASSMGDAFVGVANDSDAAYWNPAGLKSVQEKSLSLMYAMWFEDINYQYVSYVQPFKQSAFGVALQYLSYGSITETDEIGLVLGDLNPRDMMLSVSYAREVFGIEAGASIKYISSQIKNTATAYAVDLGAKKQLNKKLIIGAAVQNIGTKMKFVEEEDPLPLNLKAGGAYFLRGNLLLALDANVPADNDINLCFGGEYRYQVNEKIKVSGRLGYNTKTKNIDGIKGFTCGLGAVFQGYGIDYAFVPYGELGNTHRISFHYLY